MSVSPRVAGELLTLLVAAGTAAENASRYLSTACAECGHGETSHYLTPKGSRTRCEVSTGPAGTPCPCRAWHPLTGSEVTS